MADVVGDEEAGRREEEKRKAVAEVKGGNGDAKAVEEIGAKPVEARVGEDGEGKATREMENEKKGEEKAKEAEAKAMESSVRMDVEPKTGVSFPVKLPDGKQLNSVGLRRKKVIALNINIYAFGMYADNVQLKELLEVKFGKDPQKPAKELFEAVIDSDVEMMVRLFIVFGSLTMSMVRKNFNEGLGASLKKLTNGQKNEELANKIMGAAKDSIKLPAGSVIEITRLPGYILQTKVKDELISKVQSELLCRAYFNMYLGDDPFDKEAKERFGNSLFSLL